MLALVAYSLQARTQGGECTGCTRIPPPRKKVQLRNVQKRGESSAQNMSAKKNVHVPLRYDKMKTKKVGKIRK